jgi:hypothetical protein
VLLSSVEVMVNTKVNTKYQNTVIKDPNTVSCECTQSEIEYQTIEYQSSTKRIPNNTNVLSQSSTQIQMYSLNQVPKDKCTVTICNEYQTTNVLSTSTTNVLRTKGCHDLTSDRSTGRFLSNTLKC